MTYLEIEPDMQSVMEDWQLSLVLLCLGQEAKDLLLYRGDAYYSYRLPRIDSYVPE